MRSGRVQANDCGISCMEIYVPKTFVEQSELEEFDKVGKKYTVGLGQERLSFATESEDVVSLAFNALLRLMRNNKIDPKSIGRLEVGTETLIDKSKSVKTYLMDYFKQHGNEDIEGAMSVNACYGGTAALFNSIAWMESRSWDGRDAIVIMSDVAFYKEGSARATGGAGAVAILITPNAPITFEPYRASNMRHCYDFYKPYMDREYPEVNGMLSVENYFSSLGKCYQNLKSKYIRHFRERLDVRSFDHILFHSPFNKQVKKSFAKLIYDDLKEGEEYLEDVETVKSRLAGSSRFGRAEYKVLESSIKQLWERFCQKGETLSKQVGNIYTGSLYLNLASYLLNTETNANKRLLMFSYGSGSMSTMFIIRVNEKQRNFNTLRKSALELLSDRVMVEPKLYSQLMTERKMNYNQLGRSMKYNPAFSRTGTIIFSYVDVFGRRMYNKVLKNGGRAPFPSGEREGARGQGGRRLLTIASALIQKREDGQGKGRVNLRKDTQVFDKFYKKNIEERTYIIEQAFPSITKKDLSSGGLTLSYADKMIENCIGRLSLPLGLGLNFKINHKDYQIPMVIEEPSVVAAASSAAKFISTRGNGFLTQSTENVMIGQIQLLDLRDANKALEVVNQNKLKIIEEANKFCQRMVKRGGGVKNIHPKLVNTTTSNLNLSKIGMQENTKMLIVELHIDVCDSMGANLVNTVCEKISPYLERLTASRAALRILTNLCYLRRARASFEIPIAKMGVKKLSGLQVTRRIMEAYLFASSDHLRAVTHNKGVMNGISAVALATGQDWRAVEAAAHSFAGSYDPNGKYSPMTKYSIVESAEDSGMCLRGEIEIPISVGTRGGNPDSRKLAEIMVAVGLAQNFAALKALALEGIQKGHMRLHSRNLAISAGVPLESVDRCVEYMEQKNAHSVEAAKEFLITYVLKPKI